MRDRDRLAAIVEKGRDKTHEEIADMIITAGFSTEFERSREKARRFYCERVTMRGLFGVEWKCTLLADHPGACR